jgi:hypothetical protein
LVVVDSSIRTSYQFLLECTSFKRKNYFYLLSVLQTDKRKVWRKETDLCWWCAQWYIDACKWLRLKHTLFMEQKNIMERFIQQIKDRTECFDDHFPCVKDGCNMQHVWNWLRMFLLYLHMETDRIKFTNFLIKYS